MRSITFKKHRCSAVIFAAVDICAGHFWYLIDRFQKFPFPEKNDKSKDNNSHTFFFPGDLFIVTSDDLIPIKSFSFVHTRGNVWKEPIRFSALLKIIIPIGVTKSFREKAFSPRRH